MENNEFFNNNEEKKEEGRKLFADKKLNITLGIVFGVLILGMVALSAMSLF